MQRLTTLLLLAGITFTAQAQIDCGLPHDINNNGSVDIEDFLSILGLFGDQDSDGDGLYDSQDGCADIEACNYLEPLAGICTYPDAVGDCNGSCPLDADGDGVCDGFTCGNPLSFHGYDYATVLIGEQCWFAENLRSEYYENGNAIPSNLNDFEWSSTTSGALAVYGEDAGCENFSPDIDACDPAQSLNEYGRLYNWYAVNDARGLCPSGWHVPTHGEWTVMTDHWGGYSGAGGQMKTDYGWYNGGNGTNSSGFSGLPGGHRGLNGGFSSAGEDGSWWSSSPHANAWSRSLNYWGEYVFHYDINLRVGYSVRCIQDSEE